MSTPLEDYAMIGDCHTAALVSRGGSIDWLCLPRFDSPACFAALLGDESNGYWKIAPLGEFESSRRYRGETMILETEFRTGKGLVRLTDWMDIESPTHTLHRMVECLDGEAEMRVDYVPRFDYGSIVPWLNRAGDGSLHAIAGPDILVLRSDLHLMRHDLRYSGVFKMKKGGRHVVSLTWHVSYRSLERLELDWGRSLAEAELWWRSWAAHCRYNGPYREKVVRSLLVLKSLIYAPTGGMVAAPTTSIPEALGGERNWDYRYCWIRDSTFMLYALMQAGYTEEAREWRSWMLRAVAGMPSQVNIVYGVRGQRRLNELTLDWLDGYDGSRPVRIGNAAYSQMQHDIFGEIADTYFLGRKQGIDPIPQAWAVFREMLKFLETQWEEPDEGIWEMRGGRQLFTHSKVMAWVAFDRAVKIMEKYGTEGPLQRWRELRTRLREQVLTKGYDPCTNSFTQAFGSSNVDASLLMLPLVGFIHANDPRMIGTVKRIEDELMPDGFVLRYRVEETRDGLSGEEGAFLPCSFWLVDNYVLQGETAKARELFERLQALTNDVGLLSEEFSSKHGRLVGNFPQAFSHIGLVNSALNLERRHGPARDRAEHGTAT